MMVYHTKRGAALMSFLIMVNSNPGEKRPVRTRPLALPLGELSPQVTERAIPPLVGALSQPSLSVLASLGHLSQRERQGGHGTPSRKLPAFPTAQARRVPS